MTRDEWRRTWGFVRKNAFLCVGAWQAGDDLRDYRFFDKAMECYLARLAATVFHSMRTRRIPFPSPFVGKEKP